MSAVNFLTSVQAEGNGANLVIYREEQSNEMKYVQLVNLAAGANSVITSLTAGQKPYGILLYDSSGNNITSDVQMQVTLSGGFYVLSIYCTDALAACELKILY